jgi:hypothetical protein
LLFNFFNTDVRRLLTLVDRDVRRLEAELLLDA